MNGARAFWIAFWLAAALPPAAAREVPAPAGAVALTAGTMQVLFTPGDDIEGAVVEAVRVAKSEVLVQAFTFTSRTIARALVEAHARGVKVRVTADAAEAARADNSRVAELAAAGVAVLLDDRFQSAHNKVMVIDADSGPGTVITGSFNWSYAAQRRNAENVVIFRGQRAVSMRFRQNWERLASDARPYPGR